MDRSAAARLEPLALGLALASPLVLLTLAPDGLALLPALAAIAVPLAALYGLYRLLLRGRPRPERRPRLVPPPLAGAPPDVRAAWFEVRRKGRVALQGSLDEVIAAARAGAVEPFDVVAGAGVEVAPADLADLTPFVPSAYEAKSRRLYLVYLAASDLAALAGIAALAAARLGGGAGEDAPIGTSILFFALAVLPLPFLRREWRRLADGRARGLVPEGAAALRAAPASARPSRLAAAVAGPAPATRAVLAVVVAVSAVAMFLPPAVLQDRLAKDNDAIRAGEVWRLLTAGLVHGGFLHLFMNAWVLSDLGRLVERLLGPRRMLAVLWGGVLTGSLASFVFTASRSVGISGGLFALVGALLVVGVRHRRSLPPGARRTLVRAPVEVIALNLALGLALPFIDNAAHLGGLAGGILLGLGARFRPEVAAALRGGDAPP
jgi:membrane associated rhomboid family serine protease